MGADPCSRTPEYWISIPRPLDFSEFRGHDAPGSGDGKVVCVLGRMPGSERQRQRSMRGSSVELWLRVENRVVWKAGVNHGVN